MLPIAIAILICLILWIVFTSARARKFFFLATSLLLVIGCFWFLKDELPSLGRKTEISRAEPVYPESMDIAPGDMLVDNIAIQKPDSEKRYYAISGNIANNSSTKTLSAFKLRVLVSDCSTEPRCTVVGDQTIRIRTSVPPGESRAFEYELSRLTGIPKRDGLSWKWSVIATYAD